MLGDNYYDNYGVRDAFSALFNPKQNEWINGEYRLSDGTRTSYRFGVWDRLIELVDPLINSIYEFAILVSTIICVIGVIVSVVRYLIHANNPRAREEEKVNLSRSILICVLISASADILCLIAAFFSGAL